MGKLGPQQGADSQFLRASLGDPQQFAPIFERHARDLWRYLAGRVALSAVDDLLSETFIIAFRTRHAYDGTYPDARPWLFGIATNVIRHYRRSEGRRLATKSRLEMVPIDTAESDRTDEVVAHIELDVTLVHVKTAMSRIEDKFVDVLLLSAGYGFSYEEIARALDIPIGTVRSRLSRGRAQLRELLSASGQYTTDRSSISRQSPAEERPQ